MLTGEIVHLSPGPQEDAFLAVKRGYLKSGLEDLLMSTSSGLTGSI